MMNKKSKYHAPHERLECVPMPQEQVMNAKDEYNDFIYDLIEEAFEAGRQAEANYHRTNSISGYKAKLFQLQIDKGVEALQKAKKLADEYHNFKNSNN